MAMLPANHTTSAPDPGAVLTKALVRVCQFVGINQRELAEVIGVSESTTSRMFNGGFALNPASKEGELGLLFLRACRSLDALLGGDGERMAQWLRAPNLHLGAVPAEQLRRIEGLVHVADYLDAMRGKL